MSLGSYRGSPFVTGSFATGTAWNSPVDGVETEILDYASGTWVRGADYPFSPTGRYVLFKKYLTFLSVLIAISC